MTTSVLKLKFKLETISHETILYMPQILWSRPQSCDDFWAIISLINSLVFLGSTVELFISSALYCSIDFVDEQKRWCPCQRPWYYRNLCKFFFPLLNHVDSFNKKVIFFRRSCLGPIDPRFGGQLDWRSK